MFDQVFGTILVIGTMVLCAVLLASLYMEHKR